MRLRNALIALACGLSLSARSTAQTVYHLDIAPGDLTSALELLARQTHVEFIYSADETKGLSTRGVRGDVSAAAAVEMLLEGTNLVVKVDPSGALLITRSASTALKSPISDNRHNSQTSLRPDTHRERESEIVVTASKRQEPLSQVAGAVSVISGVQLEQRGANGLTDYLGFLPGVGIQSFGHMGFDSVFIRGIAPQSVGATTSTYIDEVPVGPASALTRGGFFTVDLNPSDLERVEVLKGPQGTLYGASSMGGVIKYVTRRPDLSHPELDLYEDFDTIENGSGGVSVRATGSAPLIHDSLAVRLSGYYRHMGGFIDDPGAGGSDTNRANARGARVTLLYQPFDELSLKITALDQRNQFHGNDSVDFNLTTGRPVYGADFQLRYVPEPSQTDLQLYSAELQSRLRWFDLVAATSYSALRPREVNDLTEVPLPITRPTRAVTWDAVSKITQEIRLATPRRGLTEWMIGGFFQHERLDYGSLLQLLSGADHRPRITPALGEDYHVGSLTEGAAFSNASVYLGNVDVTGGLRVSHLGQSQTHRLKGAFFNPTDPLSEMASHEVVSQTVNTYLLAMRWRPNADVTVYGRAASGYRPGGGRALPPGVPPGLSDYYTSDALWSYETGLRLRTFQQLLQLDLSGFWINWTHIQALQPAGPYLLDGNAGGARSRGIELQADYSARQGLEIGVNAALTDARFTESVPLADVKSGEPLYFVPKWSAALTSRYSRLFGRGWRIQIAGDFQYQSNRLTVDRTPLPAYSLWNARIAFNNERFRTTFYVNNITNKETFLGAVGASSASHYAFAVGPPRTIGVLLSQDFL
jgi:iron complex outermembrane recepter protein